MLPSERTLMRVHVGLGISVATDASAQDFCAHAVLARHADHVAAGLHHMSLGSVAGRRQRGHWRRPLTWSQARDAGPTAGGVCRPAGMLAYHACCLLVFLYKLLNQWNQSTNVKFETYCVNLELSVFRTVGMCDRLGSFTLILNKMLLA